MANKVIKGLTVEIGGDTTKLGEALEKVNKKSGELSSELGQINKLLKIDPGNTELLAQKQKVLSDAVGNTKEKLETLREAEKQVQEQFERKEVSIEQVRALQREIIATEKKQKSYEDALRETKEAQKGVADTADKAGKEIEESGEEAKEAEREWGDIGETLEKGVAGGLMAVAGACTAAVAGLAAAVESTEEYRLAMGKLDTAFEQNGFSAEQGYKAYSELQGILGETDQALEAASFLSKLATTEEDLAKWTDICTGIYGQFGAALPVEGLTEAANETAKVGQVTGPLADALNWAAKEGETFGVAMKEATKENEEWNKAVEAATSAEDYFNLALQQCADETERTALITETLAGMYGDLSDAYKENNKDIIANNKATERTNKAWAEVGKKAAPLVTTFKEGVADLAEEMVALIEDVDTEEWQKTIKGGFEKLSKDVLPKLIDVLEWCIENFDSIASVASGFIAALAVNKIATFIGTLGSMVKALQGAKSAQEALNRVTDANPYVLLATAISGVAVALGGLIQNELKKAQEEMKKAREEAYGLTEQEKELAQRTKDATEAFKNQRDSYDSSVGAIDNQMGRISNLKDELFKLADAEGKVDEKNRTRAQFILNELNNALGTEYTMVDGEIQKYDELAASIDEVILKKKANLLLEASAEQYAAALQSKKQAEDDYFASLTAVLDATAQKKTLDAELEELYKKRKEATKSATPYGTELAELTKLIQAKEADLSTTENTLAEMQSAYENNKLVLSGYYTDIGQYEAAQMLTLEGNTAEAAKVLSDRAYYEQKYAAAVGEASDDIRSEWELDLETARKTVSHTRLQWSKGTQGYTKGMVDEAKEAYNTIKKEGSKAGKDAEGVGENIGEGVKTGLSNKQSYVASSAATFIRAALNSMKAEAKIKSPSREAIKIFEFVGEGAVEGLENMTKPLMETAQDQMRDLLDAYGSIEALDGRVMLQTVESAAQEQHARVAQSAAAEQSGKLDLILKAIEKGQIIALDGDKVVGGTLDRFNRKLGAERNLVALGAK